MPESDDNPWVTALDVREQADVPTRQERREGDFPGPDGPQPGIKPPSRPLPAMETTKSATVWWLGTHGGAGESTLAALLPGSRDAGHAWPVPGSAALSMAGAPSVILVARTNAHGLRSAQGAMTEWASGGARADLLGLVLVADTPGRLPRQLREYCQLLSGGVPRTWNLPWVERWRLGEEPLLEHAPRAVQKLVSDVTGLVESTS